MKKFYSLIVGLLIIFACPVFAQDEDLEILSLEELLDVKVVSAVQRTLQISEAPSVVRVITAGEIEKRGYRSIGEALISVPGIYVSNDYIGYDLNIRGINGGMRSWGRLIKLLIDGHPAGFRYNGMNFLGPELIPIEAVQRIEIMLGSGATMYGPHAYLGVINVITKEGDDIDGLVVTAKTGTENEQDADFGGSVVYGRKTSDIEFMVAASGAYGNRSGMTVPKQSLLYERYRSLETQNDLSRPLSFYGKFSYEHYKYGRFAATANLQSLNNAAEFADWGILLHNNTYSLHSYFANLMWEKSLSDKVVASLSLTHFGGSPNSNDKFDFQSDIYYKRRDMGYSSLDLGFYSEYMPSDKFNLNLGLNYTLDNYNLETIWSIFKMDYGIYNAGDSVALMGEAGDTTFANMSVHVEAIYNPTSYFSFTEGLTFDKHNVFGDFFNTQFGIVTKYSDEGYFKFLFGTTHNTPLPSQIFSMPLYSGDVVGNPDIRPEFAKTFDFEFTPFNTEVFQASFDVFYNFVSDRIGYVYEDGIISPRNLDDLTVFGVEGALRWSYKDFTTNWTISYQQTMDRTDYNQNTESVHSDDVNLIDAVSFEYPQLHSYNSLNYTIPKARLNFNFEQRFVGVRNASQPNIALNEGNVYVLGPYQTLNFTLSTVRLKMFSLGETKFILSIRNITDEEYLEPGYNGIEIPGRPRSVYFSVSQEF